MKPNLTPFERWLVEVAYDAGYHRVSPITGEVRGVDAWIDANGHEIDAARGNDDVELFRHAAHRWGVASQIAMVAEEAAELVVATMHMIRYRDGEASVRDFCEELADVEIMIDQMRACGYGDRIDASRREKIRRLRFRLGLDSKAGPSIPEQREMGVSDGDA